MLLKIKSVILVSMFSLMVFAQEKSTYPYYRDALYLGNIYSGSTNPVAISHAPFLSVADIGIKYHFEDGDFRAKDQTGKETGFDVSMWGIKKFNRISFEGGISYYNDVQRDKSWNTTLFIAPSNPFILADSVASRYNVERFNLNGGFAYEISPMVKLGLRAFYEVGSSADQTDPRPDTKAMKFRINPGFTFSLSRYWELGISGEYRMMNEQTDYTCVRTEKNYTFFLFSGLGTYLGRTGVSYSRQYKGRAYNGALQAVFANGFISNMIEAGIDRNQEEAIDGGKSDKFLGGKYNNSTFFVTERFQVRSERLYHNITFDVRYSDSKGTWYNQKQMNSDTGEGYWEVMSSEIKHKEKTMTARLGYRMDMMRGETPTLTWSVTAGYGKTETHNYPEDYTADHSYIDVKADIAKHFKIKKSVFTVSLYGNYRNKLSADLDTRDLRIYDEYTLPMWGYATASAVGAGGGLNVKLPLPFKGFISYLGIFARGGYVTCLSSEYEPLKKANRSHVYAGVNFIF